MTDFRIRIIADPSSAERGAHKVESAFKRLERQANRLRNDIRTLFVFGGLTAGVGQIVKIADSFTNLENRIRTVTKTQEELEAVTRELGRVATDTRADFATTAEVYARTAAATRQLGISQKQTIQFTESLNQAVALSGATAIESKNALIQLSQGLAAGALRGDELRSVLEQLPAVADVIAEHFDTVRGNLKALGKEGKLSTEEIFKAFSGAQAQLALKFSKSVVTVGQAFTKLRTQITLWVAEMDDSFQITNKIADATVWLSQNLDDVARAAKAAGIALAVGFARKGVQAATTAIVGLTAAMATNPLGLLAVAIAASIGLFVSFKDEISSGNEKLGSMGNVAKATFEVVGEQLRGIFDPLAEVIDKVSEVSNVIGHAFTTMFGTVEISTKNTVNFVIGSFVAFSKAIPTIMKGTQDIVKSGFFDMFSYIKGVAEDTLNYFVGILNRIRKARGVEPEKLFKFDETVNPFEGATEKLKKALESIYDKDFAKDYYGEITSLAEKWEADRLAAVAKEEAARATALANLGNAGDAPARDTAAFDKTLAGLEEELVLRRSTIIEISKYGEVGDAIAKAKLASGKELLVQEHLLLESAGEQIGSLKEQAAILNELHGPTQELEVREKALNDLKRQGIITLDEYRLMLFKVLEAKQALANEKEIDNDPIKLATEAASKRLEGGASSTGTNIVDTLIVSLDMAISRTASLETALAGAFGSAAESLKVGISDALAGAISQGESFGDTMINVAKTISDQLLSSIIQIGIEEALNAAQRLVFSGAADAATVASGALAATTSTAVTGTIVANNATIATSAAPAAELEAAATFGASAVAGIAALAAIIGFASAGLKDGGPVSGAGTSRSDSIPTMLSDGEFVINAKSTKQFRPMLERINSGRGIAMKSGGSVSEAAGNSTSLSTGGNTPITAEQGNKEQDIAIVNVVDSASIVAAMGTQQGKKVLLNTVRLHKSDFKSALGV